MKTEKSSLQKEKRQKKTISLRVLEDNTCPNYQSKRYISIPGDLDGTTIPYKPQTDYASEIVGHNTSVVLDLIPNGYCESPTLPKKVSLSFEPYFSLGKNDNHAIKLLGEYVLKSFAGLKVDLDPVSNGFVINQSKCLYIYWRRERIKQLFIM